VISTALALLVHHGYAVLFVYVLASQLGLPLPSAPLLVAAGALAATGRLGMGPAMGAVVLASLIADSTWYILGRLRGSKVIRLLCRMSLEPTVCVRRTEGALARYGARFLLVAKFFPGLGLMAAPTAGQSRLRYVHFLAFDAAGACVWAGTYILIGRFVGRRLEHHAHAIQGAAHFAVLAFLCAVGGWLVIQLTRRRRFRRRFAMARITATDLKKSMDRGEALCLVDLRDPMHLGAHRRTLPGAVHLSPDELLARRDRIPTDVDVVLFCSCPEEATAVQVATDLRRLGLARVYPLQGGLDEWVQAGYPLAELPTPSAR
jgi:membrane protein DedA with SNARE-associated domain/rhodanese-related sulfurtransferase